MTTITRLPAGTPITEAMIAAAEEIANEAEARYVGHEDACTNYRRDLACLRCQQLWVDARETGRRWESLVAEHTRQQMAAEHERLMAGVR